jgi:hypothetical protein
MFSALEDCLTSVSGIYLLKQNELVAAAAIRERYTTSVLLAIYLYATY